MVGRRTEVIGPCGCCPSGGATPPTTKIPCVEALVYNTTSELYGTGGSIPYGDDETPVWSSPYLADSYELTIPTITLTPNCVSSCLADSGEGMFNALMSEVGGTASLVLNPGGNIYSFQEGGNTGDTGYPTSFPSCGVDEAFDGIALTITMLPCGFSNSYSESTFVSGKGTSTTVVSGKMAAFLELDWSMDSPFGTYNEILSATYAAHFAGDPSLSTGSVTFELVGYAIDDPLGVNTPCVFHNPAGYLPATLSISG